LPEELPAIRADESQIQQVVMNLIMNAAEAIGEARGRVTVSARVERCERGCSCRDLILGADEWPDRPCVILQVTDTGCGMDEATRSRVFEPFFTTKFTGRGLGLAAVHGILRGHKAGIAIDSELGQGTSISVHFPAQEHPAMLHHCAERVGDSWQGTGAILLVDDEATVRRVGEKLLRRLGFSVITASDGVEAVDLFRDCHDDLACVVLDLKMPRMDGEETFAELGKIDGDVPVILTSGYGEQESTRGFHGRGLAGFLQKPYQLASVKAQLRKVLGDWEQPVVRAAPS
jgi:two-component system cell cycle sensor histidine kinase/response regulator CckA